MPSTEQVKMAWLQGCAVVPVGGREGRTRGDEVERQPVGWMLAVQGCLGHAGDALSRGGLQVVVLCKMARARRHCIEDESPNNESRIVGQTWPIPTLHSALCTLHPSSPPARSPAQQLAQSSRRPGSSAVFAPTPSAWPSPAGRPGPQSGHNFSG